MKKLAIAVIALTVGVVANAASIMWGSSPNGIELPDSSIADSQVTMYLYEITAADYASFSGTPAAISTAVYNQYGTTSTSFALDDWGVAQITDSRDFASGDTAYAAVVFMFDDGTDQWYKGNIAAYTFDSGFDQEIADLDVNLGGNGLNAGGAIAWTVAGSAPVPEPTSGLLLILGMAGLALKRKRA